MSSSEQQYFSPRLNYLLLLAYIFINSLFVIKYSSRITNFWPLFSCGFIITTIVIAIKAPRWLSQIEKYGKLTYILITAIFFVVYSLLMWRVDPMSLNIDRFSAIITFCDSVLNGQFPYTGRTHMDNPISGFPGLFLLMMPFHFIGNAGFFNLAVFLLFIRKIYQLPLLFSTKIVLLILFGASPAALFEITVRSELIANMILILLLCDWIWNKKKFSYTTSITFGIISGILLCTRGIVLLPLTVFGIYYLRNTPIRHWITSGTAFLSIIIVLFLPFYIWDPILFAANNPFLKQTGYIPTTLVIVSWIVAIIIGLFTDTEYRAMTYSAILIFIVIIIVFVQNVFIMGFQKAIFGSGVDISYFIFSLPFIIYSLYSKSITE
jgi:hypothetical protein